MLKLFALLLSLSVFVTPAVAQRKSDFHGFFYSVGEKVTYWDNQTSYEGKVVEIGSNGISLKVEYVRYGETLVASMARSRIRPYYQIEFESRTWTSKKGNFSVDAKLKKIENESVLLVTDEGKELTVEVSKLCTDDKVYIDSARQNLNRNRDPTLSVFKFPFKETNYTEAPLLRPSLESVTIDKALDLKLPENYLAPYPHTSTPVSVILSHDKSKLFVSTRPEQVRRIPRQIAMYDLASGKIEAAGNSPAHDAKLVAVSPNNQRYATVVDHLFFTSTNRDDKRRLDIWENVEGKIKHVGGFFPSMKPDQKWGNCETIEKVCFLSNSVILTEFFGKQIVIWNADQLKPIARHAGRNVTTSPNQKYTMWVNEMDESPLVTFLENESLQILNRTVEDTDHVVDAKISPDGSKVAVVCNKSHNPSTLRVYDFETWELLHSLRLPFAAGKIRFWCDENYVMVSNALMRISDGRYVLRYTPSVRRLIPYDGKRGFFDFEDSTDGRGRIFSVKTPRDDQLNLEGIQPNETMPLKYNVDRFGNPILD